MTALLEVKDLSISYRGGEGPVFALRHANLQARAGEVVGIVGESGCGKSTLASALMALFAGNVGAVTGAVTLGNENILAASPERQRAIRGRRVAMIFQDPMTAFNPVLTIGRQLVDFQHHLVDLSKTEKTARAAAMLARVGIPDPAHNMNRYVHELSGGMRQRAAIAAALLLKPDVLVADEPTTALDVTMEAQIIHLLRELGAEHDGAIVVITHHLGLVGELCDRVYVMYAGEVVEEGPVDVIYHAPRHPYTQALIACDPASLEAQGAMLPTIPGSLPDVGKVPQGCAFASRCPIMKPRCLEAPPPMVETGAGHRARCYEAMA